MVSAISAVMILALIGGLVYVIFRSKENGGSQIRDGYFYLASFVSLVLLYWAVADVLRIWLADVWGTTSRYYGQQATLKDVSLRLSTLLVGLPFYGFHWYKATVKKPEEIDYHGRRVYCLGILTMTSLVILGGGTGLVYQGMNAVLGVAGNAAESLAWFVPYTLAAAGLWYVHFKMWKDLPGKNPVKQPETQPADTGEVK